MRVAIEQLSGFNGSGGSIPRPVSSNSYTSPAEMQSLIAATREPQAIGNITDTFTNTLPIDYAAFLLAAREIGRESGAIAARTNNIHATGSLPTPNLLTYLCNTLGVSKRASRHLRALGQAGVSNVCMLTIFNTTTGEVNIHYQHRGTRNDFPEATLALYPGHNAVYIAAGGPFRGSGDISGVPDIHPVLFTDIAFAARSLMDASAKSL